MKQQILILSIAAISISSCDATAQKGGTTKSTQTATSNEFSKTPGGLEYRIVKKGAGTYAPQPGDYTEMRVIYKIGDTVVLNTDETYNNQPVPNMVQQPNFSGDLNEGLLMLKAGDSAIFRIDLDTLVARTSNLPQKYHKPPFAKPGDKAQWFIKMETVTSKAEKEQQQKMQEQEQAQKDDQIIQQYLATNNLKAQKTASGVYYILTPGTGGGKPTTGQKIALNYTGMLLDGTKFDSSIDPAFGHVQPLEYKYGVDHMIKGWDEGVDLMKKGDKIKIIIPSALGYGASGRPPKIPGNSVLLFDMELVSFE